MTPTSEVFIQAGESDPAVQARVVVRAAHQRLLADLQPKVALLTELELSTDARETALATLTASAPARYAETFAATPPTERAGVLVGPACRMLLGDHDTTRAPFTSA
ncbi:hypothetical protein [Streptomyces nodosus]|uniref:Uncharacterized protein n=1 Tax=Streptomyces nodosus TaxID=40318 RepID=A0A5P2VUX5_9ACTN|nr:hypothetical protein [Streptomyces nodosus]MBB4789661.1 hypothetical protein [Streptomyces nodosus]QEV37454.1 hypothetical protein CP978_01770 [Streptomyces nodosus]